MAANQAPPSLGFSRQEHWGGLPFPSPMHENEKWKWSRSVVSDSVRPHGLQPTRVLRPWDFPGKSTGVGCHCLLWGLNLGLPYCRQILYQLSHNGSPGVLAWVAYPFCRGSSRSRNWTKGLLHCWQILYQLSYQESPPRNPPKLLILTAT